MQTLRFFTGFQTQLISMGEKTITFDGLKKMGEGGIGESSTALAIGKKKALITWNPTS